MEKGSFCLCCSTAAVLAEVYISIIPYVFRLLYWSLAASPDLRRRSVGNSRSCKRHAPNAKLTKRVLQGFWKDKVLFYVFFCRGFRAACRSRSSTLYPLPL